MPRVSVLMSVYNGEPYLRESVESILQQTYEDFEFIIFDDGSTDDTSKILSEYGVKDQRVQFIQNKKNIGLTKSLNKGLRIAQGEYIARQDSDDISLSDRFGKQVKVLDDNPRVVLVSSNLDIVDADGAFLRRTDRSVAPTLIAWHLLFYNYLMGHSVVMFRRKQVLDIGGYSDKIRYSQDYELWLRLSNSGDIVILSDVLLKLRKHKNRIKIRARSDQRICSLINTKDCIVRLIGHDISLSEAEELRSFWTGHFPNAQQAGALQSKLKQVYRAFVSERGKKGSCDKYVRHQLCFQIGQRFLLWARTVIVRPKILSILRILFYASTWYSKWFIWLIEMSKTKIQWR